MTGFDSGPDFWNPNDTSALECGVEAADDDSAIVRTASDVVASTDSTALAALPAGHSVARFVRAADDHGGTFYVGHGLAVSSGLLRVAARWYIYHSSGFEFKGEGTCNNSKIAEFNNDSRVDFDNGTWHTYNYLTFSPSVDCCSGGPGPGGPSAAEMRGRWFRFEAVLTNRSGPDYRMQFYTKNVTDDEAEIEAIDLWANPSVDNLTPPSLMSQILSNNHRFASSGVCGGWLGISHYMYAGWTTNAGQRIGAASEIEGGGGGGGETVGKSSYFRHRQRMRR
jgi:hypothetical protein